MTLLYRGTTFNLQRSRLATYSFAGIASKNGLAVATIVDSNELSIRARFDPDATRKNRLTMSFLQNDFINAIDLDSVDIEELGIDMVNYIKGIQDEMRISGMFVLCFNLNDFDFFEISTGSHYLAYIKRYYKTFDSTHMFNIPQVQKTGRWSTI